MKIKMRYAVALALIAVGVTAAVAVAQDGPSNSPSALRGSPPRSLESKHGCGGARQRPGAAMRGERRARLGKGVVHGELKVQRGEGFVLRVLDAGTVTSVDAGSKSITIERADDETVTVAANDQTRICKDGKPAAFGDMETGDFARIMRVTAEGTTLVRGIRVLSQEQAGAEPASLSVPA